MTDKRDECGCHRDLTYLELLAEDPFHECGKCCRWPECLTQQESDELLAHLVVEDEKMAWGDL